MLIKVTKKLIKKREHKVWIIKKSKYVDKEANDSHIKGYKQNP